MSIVTADIDRDFIADARAAQAERDKTLRGKKGLTDKQLHSIDNTVKTAWLTGKFNNVRGHTAVKKLLTDFQVLCTRNKIDYPEQRRQEISAILIEELCVNTAAFVEKPTAKAAQDFVSLTVYRGTDFSNIHSDEKFKSLRSSKRVFKLAAIAYPSAPRKYLHKVMFNIAALEQDDEFKSLRDIPYVFKHAAIHYPSAPHKFLRQVISDVAALEKEAEFASLRKTTPHIFKRAVIHYPTTFRTFLHKLMSGKIDATTLPTQKPA